MSAAGRAQALSQGPRCYYHLTEAANLPDIAASGGLLSLSERGEHRAGRWGRNADLGAEYVCTSLRPHWGILANHFAGHEAVIIVLDAGEVLELPGVRVCPHNSATPKARPHLEPAPPPSEISGALLTRWMHDKKTTEVLVPGVIPVGAFRFLVFSDAEARAAWLPATASALGRRTFAPGFKALVDGDLDGITLPSDQVVSTRTRPVVAGRDRRVGVSVPWLDTSTMEEMSLEDLEQDLAGWDEDETELDLFDQLYGSGLRRPGLGDFVDWPIGDDEMLLDQEW